MRRTLNFRLLLGLTVVIVVLGAGVHVVHGFQEKRNAVALLRRADQAEAKGDVKETEKYLLRYLVHRPDDPGALARYGLALTDLDDNPRNMLRGVNLLEMALARAGDPAASPFVEARRRAAELSRSPELKRFKESRAHYQELLKAEPQNAEILALLGQCYEAEALTVKTTEASGLNELARECYEKSITRDPGQIDTFDRLATLLRTAFHNPAAADAVIDRMVAGDPTKPRSPGAQGKAHLRRAQHRAALGLGDTGDVATAWSLAPEDREVILAEADRRRTLGEIEGARTVLEQGIALHSEDDRMYLALSRLENNAGRPTEAIAVLEGGLKTLPDRAELLAALAGLLIEDQTVRDVDGKAVRVLLARLNDKPALFKPVVDFLEGRLLIREKKLAEGVALIERSRALMASIGESKEIAAQADLILAAAYERLGNPDRRVDAYRRALELSPGGTEIQLGLGAALLSAGRGEQARQAYQAVAESVPEARIAVARLLLAETLGLPQALRDWGGVEQALRDASRANPDAAEVVALRAEILTARGQVDKARATLREAINRDPKPVDLWIASAKLAARDRPPAEVLALLEEARAKAGDSPTLRAAFASYHAHNGGAGVADSLKRLTEGIEAYSEQDHRRVEDAVADAYLANGATEQAKAIWSRQAETNPDDARPLARMLLLAIEPGERADPASVLDVVQRLRIVEGSDGALWRFGEAFRLFLLSGRGQEGGLEEARVLLTEVAARRPDWSVVPLLEGQIAERQGQVDRAVDAFTRAIDRGERSPGLIRRAVTLLNSRRRFGEAERLVARLADGTTSRGTLAQLSAELALSRDDKTGALEQARKAVSVDGKDYRDQLWLAQVCWAAGHRPESGEALRRAVTLAPTSQEAWAAYLDYLVKSKPEDRPSSLKDVTPNSALREAVAKLPQDQAAPLLTYGETSRDRQALAERRLLNDLAANPNDPALLLQIGAYHATLGDGPGAQAPLERVLLAETHATKLQQAEARRKLALIAASAGGNEAALKALKLIDVNLIDRPDSVEDRRLKALFSAMRPGGQRAAIRQFEELARALPPTTDEKFILGGLYEATGDWPNARGSYRAALATQSENPSYQAVLARGLILHGELAEARSLLDGLERQLPNSPAAIELRALLLIAEGQGARADQIVKDYTRDKEQLLPVFASLLERGKRFESAEDLYRSFASKSGQPEATLVLAEYLGRRGKTAEALDLCEVAWRTCPPGAVGLACVTVLFASAASDEFTQRVVSRLEVATRDHPDELSLRYDLANLYSKIERYEEAEAIFREARNKAPNAPGPLNNLAWLIANAHGKPRSEEALSLIEKAIAIAGPIPGLLDTRAAAHLAMGRSDLAIADLEAALAISPAPDMYLHMAQALAVAGDRNRSRTALEAAKEAGLDVAGLHPLDRKIYQMVLERSQKD